MGKDSIEHKINYEIESYCEHFIDRHLGEPIRLSSLAKATCNLISEMIFGGRLHYDDPAFQAMLDALNSTLTENSKGVVTKNIPFAKYFNFSGIPIGFKNSQYMRSEMKMRLDAKKEEPDPIGQNDMFNRFLYHQRQRNDTDQTYTGNLTNSIHIYLRYLML